jgi:hypothetical protein
VLDNDLAALLEDDAGQDAAAAKGDDAASS